MPNRGQNPFPNCPPEGMVRNEQMRWVKRGAHLLLQVRTQILNDDLCTIAVVALIPYIPG